MNAVPGALYEITFHSLRLTPVRVILLFLLMTRWKRPDFFLTRGDIHTIVGQSRLLGSKKPEPWIKIALIFASIFAAGTVIFIFGTYGIQLDIFAANWSLIPIEILVAVMNGFNEEFTLRASLLGELESSIGKSGSLLATTAYFVLGHY